MGLIENPDLNKGFNWNFGFDGWSRRKMDPLIPCHVWSFWWVS